MNKKIIGLVFTAVIICALAAIGAVFLSAPASRTPTGQLDFTVSGTNSCLRTLNSSVLIVCVPFTLAANENWQLTINATTMPGGARGWTDIYIYEGYWDGGTNNTCRSGDLYPILSDIQSVDFAMRANAPYTQTFGGSTQQSYTVFFVIPPGGTGVFHVTLEPA